MADMRLGYYEHEPAYRQLPAASARRWDGLRPDEDQDSFVGRLKFLGSLWGLRPATGNQALNLGCRGGQASFILATEDFQGAGMGYSEAALGLAQHNAQKASLDIRFVVGDCLVFEQFETAAFDFVIDNHVLHGLMGAQHRQAFLNAACHELKPGSAFFWETMSIGGAFDAATMRARGNAATIVSAGHTRYWVRQEELNAEVRLASLTAVEQGDRPPTGELRAVELLVTIATPWGGAEAVWA
jgi:SAM-dependent methyltransferase